MIISYRIRFCQFYLQCMAIGLFTIVFACSNSNNDDLIISEFTGGSTDIPAGTSCDDLNGGPQTNCRTYVIEIWNPTNVAVDLQNYSLLFRFNNSTWGARDTDCSIPTDFMSSLNGVPATYCDRLLFSGTLQAEALFMISRDGYDRNLISPQYVWDNFIYDGNDAVGLARRRSTYNNNQCLSSSISVSFTPSGGSQEGWCIIDLFGSPTLENSNYEIAGAESSRATLDVFRRKPSIRRGTTSWTSSAGTSAANSEWIVITTDSQRDYSNFGSPTPNTTTSTTTN